ncbi:hypothetical protein ACWD5F_40715 [Streptomyces sp. NPDC002499]
MTDDDPAADAALDKRPLMQVGTGSLAGRQQLAQHTEPPPHADGVLRTGGVAFVGDPALQLKDCLRSSGSSFARKPLGC